MVLVMVMLLMLMNVMILEGSGGHRTAAIDDDVADRRAADGDDRGSRGVSRTLSSRRRGRATFRKMRATLEPVSQLILVVEISWQRLELPWRRGDLGNRPRTNQAMSRSWKSSSTSVHRRSVVRWSEIAVLEASRTPIQRLGMRLRRGRRRITERGVFQALQRFSSRSASSDGIVIARQSGVHTSPSGTGVALAPTPLEGSQNGGRTILVG